MSIAPTPDPYSNLLRSMVPMDPTEALRRLQVLVQSEPDLNRTESDHSCPADTLKWLGQLHAVVRGMKKTSDEVSLKVSIDSLIRSQGTSGSGIIRAVLYRALAEAELAAPASEQGAFIAAGNELDAFAAISKVLASAHQSLLIVDPYLDGKALTDFMGSAAEGVPLRLLSDEATVKPSLSPAVERWILQYGANRPLELRLAPSKTLHDRLIVVDDAEVWSLTQSLKDFANRAHGSILKTDPVTAGLKITAYSQVWDSARQTSN